MADLAVAIAEWEASQGRSTVGWSGLTLTFTASPDHDETDPLTGDPLIDHYELWIYNAATMVLLGTEDVGKPTPNGSNEITVTATFSDAPVGVACVATVVAVGLYEDADKVAESVWSAAFTR